MARSPKRPTRVQISFPCSLQLRDDLRAACRLAGASSHDVLRRLCEGFIAQMGAASGPAAYFPLGARPKPVGAE